MDVLRVIAESLWFLLPAYFANMAPVFARKIKFLDIPVDLNRTFRGKPIFGRNKTFRGFFFGILAAVIITLIQSALFRYGFFRSISLIDYSSINLILLGVLMGFGSLAGDLVKSFFKRRVGIPAGRSWVPFDQSDYILGTLIMVAILYVPPIEYIAVMILLSIALHFISVFFAYRTGLRKDR